MHNRLQGWCRTGDGLCGSAEASFKSPPAMNFLADYGLGGSPGLGPFQIYLALHTADTP